MTTVQVTDVRFEHNVPGKTALGVHEIRPRISWRFANVNSNFEQAEYEIEVSRSSSPDARSVRSASAESHLVPWPFPETPLHSREWCSVRVRAWQKGQPDPLPWSEPASLEIGLVQRTDWTSTLICAPWAEDNPDQRMPEDLFRKVFILPAKPQSGRLYITSLGVYEAEINGQRVGDYFLAPGWTSYHGQLQYQTYDVTHLLSSHGNCLGVRVAEGWYKGRLGFAGRRNHYGTRTALLAQLEITNHDGTITTFGTDDSWVVRKGPILQAEIYDGEVYDARAEILLWSDAARGSAPGGWKPVQALPPLPHEQSLIAGSKPPVRRLEQVRPVRTIRTPSDKLVLDFGQNLVGHIQIKRRLRAPAGHQITFHHAEVMENCELGIRPLRNCKARDIYTFRGDADGETYAPRFTFHGFRYVQIDGWLSGEDPLQFVEAVVCNTDMEEAGSFSCSDQKINQLFSNTRWSMRGNFLSLPTDCPQRDERLGWTGDLALFAPTATLIYNCFGILKDWLRDVAYDQQQQGGVPPMVVPNVLQGVPIWGDGTYSAIWNDVTILAPWALWEETKDAEILEQQYQSMTSWLESIPRNKSRLTHLWDLSVWQLGDWLDPNAPPEDPQKAVTDPSLVANAFLTRCLDLMSQIAAVVGRESDADRYHKDFLGAREEFVAEYVTASGRLVSDSQTAYALAICFGLISPQQAVIAGQRLAEIVKSNGFRIGTGFAGTPFICEALVRTGQVQTASRMLLNENCPSWLYPISMGATTIWERWDSMRPDGSINPGEMTSFNHYAFGAISKFLFERVAGLQKASGPGWKQARVQPVLGLGFTSASAEHLTPYGMVSSRWYLTEEPESQNKKFVFTLHVAVPPTTTMEVVMPTLDGRQDKPQVVGSGQWTFTSVVRKI
ncbi:bacterial alpha-L-rhamnosidase domain protein [Aspergillus heterothallicus]